MAYCTVAQVKLFFPEVIGSTFDLKVEGVTDADVTDTVIPEYDALIDSRLRGRVTVPVTDATDLILLRLISSQFVAQRIWDILFSRKTDIADPDRPNDADWGKWGAAAERLLKDIESGKLTLHAAQTIPLVYGGLYESAITPAATMATEY